MQSHVISWSINNQTQNVNTSSLLSILTVITRTYKIGENAIKNLCAPKFNIINVKYPNRYFKINGMAIPSTLNTFNNQESCFFNWNIKIYSNQSNSFAPLWCYATWNQCLRFPQCPGMPVFRSQNNSIFRQTLQHALNLLN